MQIHLNTYGAYLHVKDEIFEVRLAVLHQMDIVFLENDGRPLGRVWHAKLGSTTLIRKRQLACSIGPAARPCVQARKAIFARDKAPSGRQLIGG